jgi:hypothetical protein
VYIGCTLINKVYKNIDTYYFHHTIIIYKIISSNLYYIKSNKKIKFRTNLN